MRHKSRIKKQDVKDSAKLRRRTARLKKTKRRRRVDDAVREREKRFTDIMENALEWIWEVDTDGRYTYSSPAVEKILGYKPEELPGKHFYDLFHPDHREYLKKTAFEVFAKKQPFRQFINRNIHVSGKIVWISTSGIPIIDKRGNLTGYRGADMDITELKRAEEALASEKECMAVTLRSIEDGVITTDCSGRILLFNEAAETVTGCSREKAIGEHVQNIFIIVDEKSRKPCPDPVKKMLDIGRVINLPDPTILLACDGKERLISLSRALIREKEDKIIGVVLVFRDITEKQKIEENLQRVQRLESIGVLAGGIAHDFNNILTAVIGNLSLAKLNTKPGDESFSRLTEAHKAALLAKKLTRQLLTFSKGGAPMKKVASVRQILMDTADFTSTGSGVRCDYNIPEDLWLVECDEGQIGQVVNNLIINAVQAMPGGGVIEVSAQNISVSREDGLPLQEGEYVKLSVKDHGTGIPEHDLSKIFDPYFTTKCKGSGLGLSITYSIVKQHGGYINVESSKSEGTVFDVYLPSLGGRNLV